MKKVKKEGVITVEEAKGTDTTVDIVKLYAVRPILYFSSGFTNTEKMSAK